MIGTAKPISLFRQCFPLYNINIYSTIIGELFLVKLHPREIFKESVRACPSIHANAAISHRTELSTENTAGTF